MMTSKQRLNAKLAIMETLQKSSSVEIGTRKYKNSSQALIKVDEQVHQGLILSPFVSHLFALTPLTSLHHFMSSLIFGLTSFGWLICIYLSLFCYENIILWFMPTFSGTQLGHKTRPWHCSVTDTDLIVLWKWCTLGSYLGITSFYSWPGCWLCQLDHFS